MNWSVPESLHIASVAGSFLLQSTVLWLSCLLLCRIVKRHRVRCFTWTGLLIIFTARWIWMLLTAFIGPANVGTSAVADHAPQFGRAHLLPVTPWTAQDISTLLAVACWGYIVIVIFLSIREAASHLRLKRALRYRQLPSARLRAAFDQLVSSEHIENCSLWLLPGLTTPATVGWWRPRILLPAVCGKQEPQELKAALWHELKHVQHRDAWWNTVARSCRVLLWFHPSVHHVLRLLSRERELACDAEVIRDHPDERDVYASCLLRFSRLSLVADWPLERCVGMTSGVNLLEERIQAILGEIADEYPWKPSGWLTAAALTCASLVTSIPGAGIFFRCIEPVDQNPRPAITALLSGSSAAKHHSGNPTRHSRGKKDQPDLVPPSPSPIPSHTLYSPVTSALGLEHRVGMNVVTEFNSETDSSVDGSSVAAKSVQPEPSLSPTRLPSGSAGRAASVSWKGVAVQAALKLASLAADGTDHERD